MTKTVILDTNVLYDIGLNRVRIEDIGRPKEHLCYSPISIIELVSKLDDRSFADRKAAAGVILKHRLDELPDPESYLTTAFGYELAEPAPSYSDAVRGPWLKVRALRRCGAAYRTTKFGSDGT